MINYNATPEGLIPFTHEEEKEWAIFNSEKEAKRESESLRREIRDMTTKLGNGIEGIIDSMELSQRKKLPIEMQEQYNEIKILRDKKL